MKRDLAKFNALRGEVAAIEARKPLNRAQVVAILCRQAGGIPCGCGCGEPLDPLGEGVVDEHVIPLEQTGPNDLRNRALYRRPCAVEKTKRDATNTAKCKRLDGETCTGPTRPIPQRANPWPRGQKLQSRPFPQRRQET